MTTRIFVLLGGLFGPDGAADSRGMIALGKQLAQFAPVTTMYWSDYARAIAAIKSAPAEDVVILIGYSGGGSRVTWVAGAVAPRPIKLLVAYDPSPSWQMTPLKGNVERALCYHNDAPMMFGLGGAELAGKQVENVEIAEQHLAVQFDQALHARTIEAVKEAAA